jgi:hypothetical protein
MHWELDLKRPFAEQIVHIVKEDRHQTPSFAHPRVVSWAVDNFPSFWYLLYKSLQVLLSCVMGRSERVC